MGERPLASEVRAAKTFVLLRAVPCVRARIVDIDAVPRSRLQVRRLRIGWLQLAGALMGTDPQKDELVRCGVVST
jgi:hypothetical protein